MVVYGKTSSSRPYPGQERAQPTGGIVSSLHGSMPLGNGLIWANALCNRRRQRRESDIYPSRTSAAAAYRVHPNIGPGERLPPEGGSQHARKSS